MVSFASRYAPKTSIRENRPLTNDELMRYVPSAFSVEKHESRSDRYTYIPTITLLDKLRPKGSNLSMQNSPACAIRIAGILPNT